MIALPQPAVFAREWQSYANAQLHHGTVRLSHTVCYPDDTVSYRCRSVATDRKTGHIICVEAVVDDAFMIWGEWKQVPCKGLTQLRRNVA